MYYTAFKTIVIKEVLRFSRIWVQTLLPPAITTGLYFLIFGKLIGGKIGNMAGVSYATYIAPGLIMMTVIMNSYSNTSFSLFGAKMHKYIEEFLVAPIPNHLIILGLVAGGMIRGLMVGIIVTVVSFFFTEIQINNVFMILVVSILTAFVFSLAGFINALWANTFDDISIIPTFVLTPLTYLGGIFYPIAMLSPFWKAISFVNPVLYMVNGFRYAMLGESDIPIFITLLLLIGFSVGLFMFALKLMNKGFGIRS